jgi:hypothetical protein
MKLPLVLIATLVSVVFCYAAEDPLVYRFGPRSEVKLKATISVANWVNAGAAILSYTAVKYALGRNTERGLKDALPNAGNVLRETGANGVLLEARYVKDSGATNPEAGPPNLTMELEENRLHFIGAGNVPRDVLAISLQQPSVDFADRKGKELVTDATRDYWVTNGRDGKLSIAEVDHDTLYKSARDIVLNNGLFEQMKASAYRNALSDMIRAAERSATSREAQRAAAQLLAERNEQIGKLMKIDADLQKELDKAKKANNDADKFALAATLAGAGSSIVQASEPPQKSNSSDIKAETSTQQISTPSGVILQKIRQRIAIENQVILNDQQIGAFLQKDGKTVYVPLYNGQ